MYPPALEDVGLPPPRTSAPRAAEARRGVRALVARYFFGATALAALLSALLLGLLAPDLAADRRPWIVGAFAAVAALALLGLRVRRAWVETTMFGVLALATLAIAATALLLGWGVATPGFAFYGIFVSLLCAAANRRLGLLLAALCAVMLLVVHGASGVAPWTPVATVGPSSALLLTTLLLLVGVGLAAGWLMSQVVARYVRSADEREQRFRGLLAVAADAYWEIDQDYHLVTVSDQRDEHRVLSITDGLGRLPWDLPQFDCDPDLLDALIADLDIRAPFRDRLVHWHGADGRLASFMLSGEPRFDERGVFQGYWGVARDISAEIAARQALAATETRYRELFARIPSPLVLHREGRVIDANAAGLALFGYESLEAMRGHDILAAYESGDSRERERRRLDEVAEQPAGTALPVADFRLLPRHGRRVAVRATGVSVDTDSGPATLSIYVDDTERRAAEEAVRRSEAMLSHLFDTSPDLISLTEMASGRFAMVNEAFERLTGYAAKEVIGKTSIELGLWHQPQEREQFVMLLRERGSVSDLPTQFRAKDGHPVSLLVSGARFVMDRRDYLVINARDVSEAERNRLEREAILENASIGIAVTRDRRFVLANPRFEQMFGWPRGALAGQPGSVVWPSDDDYVQVGREVGPALARGEQVEIERLGRRRDGKTFLGRFVAKAADPTHPAKGSTIWIVEDVTERRQFEQTLAAARDAAEAASRAKSAFLANTSHELRTPLNGMLHLSQLARDPALAEERRRQYLDQIADSAQLLAGIISDILDLSKIEAGRFEVESAAFDLGALLRAVEQAYATLADARGLTLELELEPGVEGTVIGDALRLRQILSNYLSNALKFTASGRLRIAARRRDAQRVHIEVQDTGQGIDSMTLARLFRPFTQADDSTTRRYGGTGLGLSICHELARLMGGSVGVKSAPGLGSTFWVELPLPPAEPAALPAAAAAEGSLEGRRVLIVEDNAVNMLIAAALLEKWGVQATQATDGLQAVDAVERAAATGEAFDAVLMDVQMPVMSGHEATRALRHREAGRGLPIIALTAAAMVSERQAAMEAGMDDFLTKPIDAEKLRAALLRWTARASS